MAAYAQNPNLKPLPPVGNFPQGYHHQAQQQQYQQQHYQQHQQQQPGANGLQRPPSFVGLPPIRRASTFSSSLGLTEEGFMAGDSSSEGASRQQQRPQGASSPLGAPPQNATAAPPMGQFLPSSQSSGQAVQNIYRPTQGAQAAQGSTQGQTWQLHGQGQPFQGVSQPPSRALMGAVGNLPSQINGSASPASRGPQLAPGGGRPVMLPPHMMPANMLQRFQPQSGWNLQESHLSEPLQPQTRHRHSPSNASQQRQQQQQQQQQQQSYGFDKETGLPLSTMSPQRKKAEQQTGDQQPKPPTSQQNQAVPASHQGPAGQRAEGDALSRIQSNRSDMTAPGADDGRNRRGSGIFSSIRDRVAGGAPQERREAEGGPKPQAPSGDAASEASILTDDTGLQARRNPVFGPKGAGTTPDNFSYSQSKDSIAVQGSSTPMGERGPPPPSQFAPPGRKLTSFFGIGGNPTPAQPGHPSRIGDVPRTSTSTSTTEPMPAGSIGGPPKKRFSALKGVFNRSPHQDGPKPGGSFVVKMPAQNQQALQGQPQGPSPPLGPGPQLGPINGQFAAGQQNVPAATGLRQPGHSLQPQQGAGPGHDGGRKPAAGILGFLKGRSDSKPGDTVNQPGMPAGRIHPTPYPGQGQFQGPQYATRVPLGPDGRPLTGASQPPQPGQYLSQSQFMQAGGQGGPGSPPQQGQAQGERPLMPMTQQSGVPQGQGHQPGVQFTGQRPPMPTQQSQFSAQAGSESGSNPNPQQAPPTLLQSDNQLTPQQDAAKPAEPTPASSSVDSPVSQKSQPFAQFSADQSRLPTASPVNLGQPVAGPQPGPNQLHNQTQGAQDPAHLLNRKPLQRPVGATNDQAALYGTGSEEPHVQRPMSVSSRPQPAPSSAPAVDIEPAQAGPASSQPSTSGHLQDAGDRAPSRQSLSAISPATDVPPSRLGPGSTSQESSQDAGSIQRPPSQQSGRSDTLAAGGNQQGPRMPPGQGYPAGQSAWMASHNGPVPPRQQQFAAFGARPNGVPAYAQPKEKEQSTISKLFKGSKASGAGAPAQEKPEKEKGAKGFMNAFKRGAKPAGTPSQPQMAHPQQPYGQPRPGMQPFPPAMQSQHTAGPHQQTPGPHPIAMRQGAAPQQAVPTAQGPPQAQPQPKVPSPIGQQAPPSQQGPRPGHPPAEPQYDQVPIPRGYGYVHGEGRLVPAPAALYVGPLPNGAAYSRPPGPVLAPGFPQQQWMQVGAPGAQVPPGGAPGPQAVSQPGPAAPTPSIPQPQMAAQAQPQGQSPPPAGSAAPERSQDAAVQQPAGGQLPPQAGVQTDTQSQLAPAPATTRAPDVVGPAFIQVSTPQPSVAPAQDQVPTRPGLVGAHSQESSASQPAQVQRSSPPQAYGPPSAQIPPVPMQPQARTPAEDDGLSSLPSQRAGRLPPMSPTPPSFNANGGFASRPPPPPSDSLSPQPAPGRTVSPVPSVQAADANISRDSRPVSPEPPVHSPSSPSAAQLTTPTQQQQRVAEDNIYDATPRQSQFDRQPQQQQRQPQPAPPANSSTIVVGGLVEPKTAGLSHEVTRPAAAAPPQQPPVDSSDSDSRHPHRPPPYYYQHQVQQTQQTQQTQPSHQHHHTPDPLDSDNDTDMESPVIASATIATLQRSPTSAPAPPTSEADSPEEAERKAAEKAKDSVAIFERAKRKAEAQREAERRLVLEEKIPVFPAADEDSNGGGGRGKDEAAPQMSATSYPGQEWNPYGEGGFEEWE